MSFERQNKTDLKFGLRLISAILFIPFSMAVMGIHGELTKPNVILERKELTVVKSDTSLYLTDLLLSDDEIYTTNRKFALRLSSGNVVILNTYQNGEVEICFEDRCDFVTKA